ncbi:hypothetical protein PanWU01x14_188420 [Parasponia andersonii]|uniref:Glabrous enhancer-binding protein-like DBD domain-containing protein n=1 Tax=Parasponia andersonii TaxID=3476 RepID=A0A2P5C2Q7_PARAD|nr:hypothetical protein PanWU01x14_188420 [Parasponia andersonii]
MSTLKTKTKLPSTPSKPSSYDQFRLLFTESDETLLLKTFLKVSKHSSPSSSTITSPNLARIRTSLGLRFSHSQIIDKLRRLRLKYHSQARTKSLIKTPHDIKLYNIARKIWGKKTQHKRLRHAKKEEEEPQTSRGSEGFRAESEEVSRGSPENGEVLEKGSVCLDEEKVRSVRERWMVLRMEEAELMAQKAELAKEQVKLVIQAFRSSSGTS